MDTWQGCDGGEVRVPRAVQRFFKPSLRCTGEPKVVRCPGMDAETLAWVKDFYDHPAEALPNVAYMRSGPQCSDGEFVWKVARAATELGAEYLQSACVLSLMDHPATAAKYMGKDLKTLGSYTEAVGLLERTVKTMNARGYVDG